jgi:hypothetical protein
MRAGQQGADFLATDWHGHDYDSRTWNWVETEGWTGPSTNPWTVPPYYTVTLCRRW